MAGTRSYDHHVKCLLSKIYFQCWEHYTCTYSKTFDDPLPKISTLVHVCTTHNVLQCMYMYMYTPMAEQMNVSGLGNLSQP